MPKVDIQFPLLGRDIPVDHGYHLFAAVSEIVPEIHDDRKIGIHSINGRLIGNRLLALTDRSRLSIRIPSDRIKSLLPLAGQTLVIGGHKIRIGVPSIRALIPKSRLYSRLVIIKGFTQAEEFLKAAERQVTNLGIRGKLCLIKQFQVACTNKERKAGTRSPYLRRTIRIGDKEIVGFALRVEALTEEESIRLQEEGIGGRRRFGCGLFIPDRR